MCCPGEQILSFLMKPYLLLLFIFCNYLFCFSEDFSGEEEIMSVAN